MTNLIIAKFGGSAIGPDGISIPQIIERVNNLKKDSKVITVFSAPLTLHNGKKRSLTDVVLEQGKNAENGIRPSLDIVKMAYQKILADDTQYWRYFYMSFDNENQPVAETEVRRLPCSSMIYSKHSLC